MNLGLCENALQSNCYVHVGPYSLRQYFRSPLGTSRHLLPPTPPSNVVAKKSTHFHPYCSQFNFVWGGRGEVANFSNIITSTSIVGSVTLFMKVEGVTRGNSLPLALNDSSASTHKRHCIEGTKHSWKNNHLVMYSTWYMYNKGPRAAKTIGNTRGKLF